MNIQIDADDLSASIGKALIDMDNINEKFDNNAKQGLTHHGKTTISAKVDSQPIIDVDISVTFNDKIDDRLGVKATVKSGRFGTLNFNAILDIDEPLTSIIQNNIEDSNKKTGIVKTDITKTTNGSKKTPPQGADNGIDGPDGTENMPIPTPITAAISIDMNGKGTIVINAVFDTITKTNSNAKIFLTLAGMKGSDETTLTEMTKKGNTKITAAVSFGNSKSIVVSSFDTQIKDKLAVNAVTKLGKFGKFNFGIIIDMNEPDTESIIRASLDNNGENTRVPTDKDEPQDPNAPPQTNSLEMPIADKVDLDSTIDLGALGNINLKSMVDTNNPDVSQVKAVLDLDNLKDLDVFKLSALNYPSASNIKTTVGNNVKEANSKVLLFDVAKVDSTIGKLGDSHVKISFDFLKPNNLPIDATIKLGKFGQFNFNANVDIKNPSNSVVKSLIDAKDKHFVVKVDVVKKGDEKGGKPETRSDGKSTEGKPVDKTPAENKTPETENGLNFNATIDLGGFGSIDLKSSVDSNNPDKSTVKTTLNLNKLKDLDVTGILDLTSPTKSNIKASIGGSGDSTISVSYDSNKPNNLPIDAKIKLGSFGEFNFKGNIDIKNPMNSIINTSIDANLKHFEIKADVEQKSEEKPAEKAPSEPPKAEEKPAEKAPSEPPKAEEKPADKDEKSAEKAPSEPPKAEEKPTENKTPETENDLNFNATIDLGGFGSIDLKSNIDSANPEKSNTKATLNLNKLKDLDVTGILDLTSPTKSNIKASIGGSGDSTISVSYDSNKPNNLPIDAKIKLGSFGEFNFNGNIDIKNPMNSIINTSIDANLKHFEIKADVEQKSEEKPAEKAPSEPPKAEEKPADKDTKTEEKPADKDTKTEEKPADNQPPKNENDSKSEDTPPETDETPQEPLTYTHDEATDLLTPAKITTDSKDHCSDHNIETCTSLDGIYRKALNAFIEFKVSVHSSHSTFNFKKPPNVQTPKMSL